MTRRWLPVVLSFLTAAAASAAADTVASPDGRVVAEVWVDAGVPTYAVRVDNRPALAAATLGLVRQDADLSRDMTLTTAGGVTPVNDAYDLPGSKRTHNVYRANRRAFTLTNATGQTMDVVFQVSDDGVAFRYELPAPPAGRTLKVTRETTRFRLPDDARAWAQPIAKAKTGWARTNPSYEEHYLQDVPAGTGSPTGAGWVYPALFKTGDTWLLVSESAPGRQYCVTRLLDDAGGYRVGFPDAREAKDNGPVNPEYTTATHTPWRVVAAGSLKRVVESTLGTDVAAPAVRAAGPEVVPGKASWRWPILMDEATVYDVQRKYIDYAADMGWRYCLVDALWDKQIGYEKTKELIDYATARNVKILLWYNSNGTWNDAPQTPRHVLLTHDSRVKEFDRLKAMGVAGLKIDFFGGDGQSFVNYYLDLLEDSAAYGFLINFHGATLPRGLQRTYPHLMTTEAVRGQEFISMDQPDADRQANHAAMLPFTRNVFDPMDFTPLAMARLSGDRKPRTTPAFELAETVLFVSGIQHYAELPETIAKVPPGVKRFLKNVPAVWDDSRFLGGTPGRDVVMARRAGGTWYVAGLNGEKTAKTLTIDVSELGVTGGRLITDGDAGGLSFDERDAEIDNGKLVVAVKPNGGFVATFGVRR